VRIHLLHLVARIAVAGTSPLRAKRIVDAAATLTAPRDDAQSAEDARRLFAHIRGRGTCLTRAIAVAACLPRSDVVIGAAPSGPEGLRAHAWLAIDGELIERGPPGIQEIARLRGRAPSTPTGSRLARPGVHS
jgi:hypothetical protein